MEDSRGSNQAEKVQKKIAWEFRACSFLSVHILFNSVNIILVFRKQQNRILNTGTLIMLTLPYSFHCYFVVKPKLVHNIANFIYIEKSDPLKKDVTA